MSVDTRSSLRSNRKYITEEIMTDEHDSLCLLPASTRCLCALLTLLLIVSLSAAILNSLQVASIGSKSFCKRYHDVFHPSYLCPKESMFRYYGCCEEDDGTPMCCAKFKLWLLLALACVAASILIGIISCIINVAFKKRKDIEIA